MKSVVVDFETYYGDDYTLSKMTTEEYVRDPRFETILCGFKAGREPGVWVDQPDVGHALKEFKVADSAVIAHHAHFDGLILNYHYGITPAFWIDTLSMARAVHGTKRGNSLSKLAERHGIGAKGDEVILAKGKRRTHFDNREIRAYGQYCVNDCELEYVLAQQLGKSFCRSELALIDSFIRMFTEPALAINADILHEYLEDLNARKLGTLIRAGVAVEDVRSNEKFAAALRFVGVEPPVKVSPTTGKWTYAFAKTDAAMQELAEHPNDEVQALVAARLGAKSTINESRAQRLIDMSKRGRACVYLNYYGAGVTGRASGGDKMNWQNFTRGGKLREAIEAPPGYVCVVGDSSNIEARILDWMSGQEDLVEAYRLYDAGKGPDIYCVMAQKIYNRAITKAENPQERQMGKTTKLGLGYGMGWRKFISAAKAQAKVVVSELESQRIVNVYRQSHTEVGKFWKRCEQALWSIAAGEEGVAVDYRGIITTCKEGLRLPNGLVIKYPDLKRSKKEDPDEWGEEWTYFDGKTRQKIYGGKVCENIVQALARILVMEQCMMVKLKLRISVHDEGVWLVREDKAEQAKVVVEEALRTPLPWCLDLPLNCEVGYHKSYGKAKK